MRLLKKKIVTRMQTLSTLFYSSTVHSIYSAVYENFVLINKIQPSKWNFSHKSNHTYSVPFIFFLCFLHWSRRPGSENGTVTNVLTRSEGVIRVGNLTTEIPRYKTNRKWLKITFFLFFSFSPQTVQISSFFCHLLPIHVHLSMWPNKQLKIEL